MNDSTHNPKHAQGMAKPNYRYLPPMPLYLVGRVFNHGALKYGAFNWGESGVCLQVYIDAMQRHLDDLKAGLFFDHDSGEPILAHIAAGTLIPLDCWLLGNIEDDRPAQNAARVGRTSSMDDLKRRLGEIAA